MNKKGLTIVELVVAFSLTTVISLFLIQVVVFLKDTYVVNAVRSEIILKQSTISEMLNSLFLNNDVVYAHDNCGEICVEVTFADNSVQQINFDEVGNVIIIGDYVAKLPSGSKLEVDSIIAPYGQGVFQIFANVTSPLIDDEVFNINLIYQYDPSEATFDIDNFEL